MGSLSAGPIFGVATLVFVLVLGCVAAALERRMT
jgi:hypothetical protein